MQQNLILIHLIYLAILINLFFIQKNMCDHDHPSNYAKSVLAQKQYQGNNNNYILPLHVFIMF